jgi:hypothetical protein
MWVHLWSMLATNSAGKNVNGDISMTMTCASLYPYSKPNLASDTC